MNIFEFAMEQEKLSEDYYRQLAENTTNTGIKNICTMLAVEEVKHYKIVQGMQKQTTEEITQMPVLQKAKQIFDSMRKSPDEQNPDISELELYQKARDIEQQSKQFYQEKAKEVEDLKQKEIFQKLADEEQKHYFLVNNICEFVAKPQWFLENAEMYRFDDYADGVL